MFLSKTYLSKKIVNQMNKKQFLINKKMIKQTFDQNNKNKRFLIKTHLIKIRFLIKQQKTLFDQTTFDQKNM